MSNYTPDWLIEQRPADVYGLTTDDAGICSECGEHFDSGPIADAAQNNFLSVDCASVLRDQALTSHAPKDAAQESFSEKQ